MPHIALSAFYALSHLIGTTIPWARYYCFYLINEETKDQRGLGQGHMKVKCSFFRFQSSYSLTYFLIKKIFFPSLLEYNCFTMVC